MSSIGPKLPTTTTIRPSSSEPSSTCQRLFLPQAVPGLFLPRARQQISHWKSSPREAQPRSIQSGDRESPRRLKFAVILEALRKPHVPWLRIVPRLISRLNYALRIVLPRHTLGVCEILDLLNQFLQSQGHTRLLQGGSRLKHSKG